MALRCLGFRLFASYYVVRGSSYEVRAALTNLVYSVNAVASVMATKFRSDISLGHENDSLKYKVDSNREVN